MRCARDGAEAPVELRLAWQVDRWHALPEAGGLLDQPAGLLQRMASMSNVYNAFKIFAQSAGQLMQLANSQPQVLAIVRNIERLEESLKNG
jgi:hypothetical protein